MKKWKALLITGIVSLLFGTNAMAEETPAPIVFEHAEDYIVQFGGLKNSRELDLQEEHYELPGEEKYYLAPSNETDKLIYDTVLQGLRDWETKIQFWSRGIRVEIYQSGKYWYISNSHRYVFDPVTEVFSENQDLFFVDPDSEMILQPTYDNGHFYIDYYSFSYSGEYDMDAFYEAERKALEVVKPGMSDLEKIIALHDYIAETVRYDYNLLLGNTYSRDVFTTYGVLVNRSAVCQGYALTYQYLLEKSGISCYMVTSKKMNHAWNMVELDGHLYHVDVTWDDPTWDRLGFVQHSNFLLSDSGIRSTSTSHESWHVTANGMEVGFEATSTIYDNAYWRDIRSKMVEHNGYYYFPVFQMLGRSCYIAKHSVDPFTGDIEIIPTSKFNVNTIPGTGLYYQTTFSGITELAGKLYFSTPKGISSMNFDGSDYTEEVSLFDRETGAEVYGAYIDENGLVTYFLDTDYFIANPIWPEEYLTYQLILPSAEPAKEGELTGMSINLSGFVEACFYFDLSEALVADEGAKILINDTFDVKISQLTKAEEGYPIYLRYTPDGIYEDNTFTIYDGDRNLVYCSEKVTVADYLFAMTDESAVGPETVIAPALLTYGYYAGVYFAGEEYLTGAPDLSSVEAELDEFLGDAEYEMVGELEGVEYLGTSLVLKEGVYIRHYLKLDEDVDPKSLQISNDGHSCIFEQKGNVYYAESFVEAGMEWFTPSQFVIADEESAFTISYSVFSYIRRAIDGMENEDLVNLVKSMVLYSMACFEIVCG